MHTQIHIPAAVHGVQKARRHCNMNGLKWWKNNGNRRQRRYFRCLLQQMCLDPESYYDEGFRRMPHPTTDWDID